MSGLNVKGALCRVSMWQVPELPACCAGQVCGDLNVAHADIDIYNYFAPHMEKTPGCLHSSYSCVPHTCVLLQIIVPCLNTPVHWHLHKYPAAPYGVVSRCTQRERNSFTEWLEKGCPH